MSKLKLASYLVLIIFLAVSLYINLNNSSEMCKYHIKEMGIEWSNKNVGDCKPGAYKGYIIITSIPFVMLFIGLVQIKAHKAQVVFFCLIVVLLAGTFYLEFTERIDPNKGLSIGVFVIRTFLSILLLVSTVLYGSIQRKVKTNAG